MPRASLLLVLLVAVTGCTATSPASPGSSKDASTTHPPDATTTITHTACVPGQSILCAGPGGCTANQVCESNGSAYGSCSCPPARDAGHSACTPGESIACVGTGGCAASQVCEADGSGYGACVCAPLPEGGSEARGCVPGQAIACAGRGCTSSQVCNATGTAYGPCVCGDDAGALACVPGQSVTCAGPGGCVSNQVCNSTGTAYAPCGCAADAGAVVCVPGQSVACAGRDGCVSNQVCNSTGTAYSPCACSNDGGPPPCVPGQSIACEGSGCASFQVCTTAGTYGPCDCSDASLRGDAGWTPASLPGLALWFDDTYGVVMDPSYPGVVVHWLDKSGNGNVATLQTDGAEGTLLDPEVLHGHDALVCPNSDTGLAITVANSPTLDWGTGDFAIAMVTTFPTNGSSMWNGNGVQLSATSSSGEWTLNAGGQSIGATKASGGFFVVVTRGASLYLNVAGTVVTGPVEPGVGTGGGLELCQASAEIAEVVAIKGTLSDPDLASLLAYFQSKFALP